MNIKLFKISICLLLYIFTLVSCAVKNGNLQDKAKTKYNFNINVSPRLVEVDNLGRIYAVNQNNVIINYKPDLSEQYRFANKKSGSISSLDVTNPLKIIAFYDDFNQVKIFDNTLSVINELNLADKFSDITACGVTNDGNLWIYDPTQFKLLKIKDNGSILTESSNVNDFGLTNVRISDIKEKGNYVVLCDRNKGFYFFDNLGQYLYHYEAKDIRSFQFDGRNVYYYTSTGLRSYSVKFKEKLILAFPPEMNKPGLKYILYQGGDLIEVNESGINVLKAQNKKE